LAGDQLRRLAQGGAGRVSLKRGRGCLVTPVGRVGSDLDTRRSLRGVLTGRDDEAICLMLFCIIPVVISDVGAERRSAHGSSPPAGGLPYEAPSRARIAQDRTKNARDCFAEFTLSPEGIA
jgi:hypothetical protein